MSDPSRLSGPSTAATAPPSATIEGGERHAAFSAWLTSAPASGFRRAVPWSVASVGGQQAVTAAVSFVLAGIVGPEAFGTIAMAMVYVFFVQLMVRQGMVQAFIQRRDLSALHADTGFWMVVAASCGLVLLSVAAAGPWASLNELPELESVLIWLSPLVVLQGLTVVQEALLRRRMDFRGLAARSLVSAVAGGVVGIAMAIGGAGVWALVGQQLSTAVVGVLVLWSVSPWRPQWRFSRPHARELLGFSSGASLNGLANFANSRADALLIGLFLGPLVVGLYRLAARFTEIVIDVFTRSIQQVALPELSRLQADPDRFRRRSLEVIRITSLITIPMLGVLAGCVDGLLALFGDEWAPAATGLRILCVVAAIRSVMLVSAAVVIAAGRPFLNAALAWASGIASIVAFLAVGVVVSDAPVTTQVAAVALARLGVHVVVIIPTQQRLLRNVAGIQPAELARATLSATVAAAAAAFVGIAVLVVAPEGAPAIVRLALAGSVSTVAALAVLVSMERDELVAALDLLRRRGAGRTSAVAT